MVAMAYIILIVYISLNSLVDGSGPATTRGNDQSDWTMGITDIPSATVGWIYDQVYTPSEQDPNSKDKSQSIKSEIPPKLIVDFDESSDKLESTKNVDDILKIIKDSSDDEKKQYASFLENLEDTLTNNPARYAKVFLKDMWHVVDLGIFNSGERRRNTENVKTLLQTIKDLLYEILSSAFNFMTGKFEDGKKGTQRGWATFERMWEKDHREWTEEEALKKLTELESQYKSMDKDVVIRDITSLCIQPLYKASTYEKISKFLETLKQEGFENNNKLQKDLGYVEYKMQFSKSHDIH
ncbi:uncharacterized protein LOC135843641 [Planococcus citri]|uniref:uncharacterized protein LOC135843641 n=1 Tax=Planococcus citri TaxID=170843 RepID=UPI0031F7C4ED